MTGEEFRAMYTEELTRAVAQHPDEYSWPPENVPIVVEQMLDAMRRGSYSKESYAIKAMCKRLGIKHTYTALRPVIVEALGA